MPLGEQRGGAELSLVHVLQHAAEVGLEPVVAFLQDGPLVARCRGLGVETVVVEAGRLRQPGAYLRAIRRLAAIARGCDAVLGWMTKAHLYSGPAAAMARRPRAWVQAGLPFRRAPVDRLAALIPAGLVITLSREGDRAQRRLRPRRPTRRAFPAVDLALFDPARLPPPADLRVRLGLPAGAPLFGTIGRLQRWKGFHVLVEALPLVLREEPEAHCVLVGGPHPREEGYLDELRDRATALGVADRIVFAGHQTNPHEWMQALDVFVHAASREPFGMVVIEAMALGKPVVATDDGGPTEIVTPGRDGVLVPYGDARRQADAVVGLLRDGELRASLGAAGRRRAAEFSTEQFAGSVAGALAALTGRTAP
jgi:glycosyltransferase involved in cell wall biosynthesis